MSSQEAPRTIILKYISKSNKHFTNFLGETSPKEANKSVNNSIKMTYLPRRNNTFWLSCVIGLMIDPLFLYIPLLDHTNMCLGKDNKLKVVALILRSFIDMFYVVGVLLALASSISKDKRSNLKLVSRLIPNGPISRTYIITDILASIPATQVIIIGYLGMNGHTYGSTHNWKILYLFLLLQYFPRIAQIYQSCSQLKWGSTTTSSSSERLGVKGAFHFFLFIIASHVLGGFWYFFSIERMKECWHEACENYPGCVTDIFNSCDFNDPRRKNMTFLVNFCSIKSQNGTFDLGIFSEAVTTNATNTTNFHVKFFQSFWWGLQNLSSFGQNLHTAADTWEIGFASFVSLIGLFLFVYLIGNLQTYLQFMRANSEEIRKIMEKKETEVDFWMQNHGLEDDNNIKPEIIKHIRRSYEKHQDVDVQNLIIILKDKFKDKKNYPEHELSKKIEETSMHLATIISDGKQHQKCLRERNVEFWMSENGIRRSSNLFETKQYIICRLQEDNDVNVVNILRILPQNLKTSVKTHLCSSMLKKVQLLFQNMDAKVIDEVVEHLKPVIYEENTYIIREGEPLDFMLFVTHGTAWKFQSASSSTRNITRLTKGDMFGQEFLEMCDGKLDCLDNIQPSSVNVKSHTKIEAFVFSSVELQQVQKRFWWKFVNLSDERELETVKVLAASVIQAAWHHYKPRPRIKRNKLPSFPELIPMAASQKTPHNLIDIV